MATLVLTAVGSAIGGPLGGAIGALLGQQADAALFAPAPRQGPRLGDLALQTSSYGTAIPKLFGTMRAAGSVIWSTDLQERRSASGGGKGRPGVVGYSYSASFAVALSGRPVRSIRRIWADGKLLRGAGGDFKSRTGFRFYPGSEEQAPDPLIASIEGPGATPAFRGIAYALFEDFELEDYGNHIPSLTFEIVADEGAVAIGAMAADLSDGEIGDGGTPMLAGYAASGESVRGALEAVAEAFGLSLRESGAGLRLGAGEGAPDQIGTAQLCRRAEIVRHGTDGAPADVEVAYYDPARDYQAGLQRASVGGGLRSERVSLAAVLAAGEAKALAERRLAAMRAGRVTAQIELAFGWHQLRPGARLRIDGQAGLWRCERLMVEGLVARLELVRVASGTIESAAASPGRPIGHADLELGATRLLLVDLPFGSEEPAVRPGLFVLAAGETQSWRSAPLSLSLDQGASWSAIGTTAAPAVMGQVIAPPGAADSLLVDRHHAIEVALANEAMWLQSCDDDALANGANLAMVGEELIQFGSAEALGGGRFRLSRLLRGRRGTEYAAAVHQAGERFALIEREAMLAVDVPEARIGGTARVLAEGRGDPEGGTEAETRLSGRALIPPSPVHLSCERRANGDLAFAWVRRSRAGWQWLDGSDTPLGEERESYALTLSGPGGTRSISLEAPAYVYAAAQQAGDALGRPLVCSVAQIGRGGGSVARLIQID